jgi:hypothetical protein
VIDSFGLLGLLFLLFTGGGAKAPTTPRRPAPRPPPMLPPGGGLVSTWPAQPATGLPAFPGSGWEYDEPPPAAVKQRAAELVPVLVKKGIGAKQIEQTAGRWIAYRVEKMRSGKNGITAWRLKATTTAPAPATRATSSPASPAAPAASLPSLPGHILTASSPGLPTAVGDRVVQVVAGRTYQWTMQVNTEDPRVTAEVIAKIIVAAGGVDVVVSRDRPFLVLYVQRAAGTGVVPLNKPSTLQVAGATVTCTILDGVEVKPKTAPPPAPLPPGVVSTTAPSSPAAVPVSTAAPAAAVNPLNMPDLKYGMGLKPAAPVPEVAIVQRRLGLTPVDGRFGGDTRDAVIKFQVSAGLAPNQPIAQLRTRGFGAVKQATWVKLFAVRA